MRLATEGSGDPRDGDDLPESPSETGRAELDGPLERPLSAYSLDEIMDELRLRFSCFIFQGETQRYDESRHGQSVGHGSTSEQVGLATQFLWGLQEYTRQ